jgi:hypothetical protein
LDLLAEAGVISLSGLRNRTVTRLEVEEGEGEGEAEGTREEGGEGSKEEEEVKQFDGALDLLAEEGVISLSESYCNEAGGLGRRGRRRGRRGGRWRGSKGRWRREQGKRRMATKRI